MQTTSSTRRLKTKAGERLFRLSAASASRLLRSLDACAFCCLENELPTWRHNLERLRKHRSSWMGAYLDDLFVLECAIDFLEAYGRIWQCIVDGKFGTSWLRLQDALDLLRIIRKFSRVDTDHFEAQLTELERAYPYNVFFSVGMTVGFFECSICGIDIDSLSCPHRSGQLYGGKLAKAVARDIKEINHIAMVANPADKRCVVIYEDTSDAFKVVRLLSDALESRCMRVSQFSGLKFSRRVPGLMKEPHLGRNQPCHCGSGKKYKRCCMERDRSRDNHVDIVLTQLPAQ